jgi:hypothetical protein
MRFSDWLVTQRKHQMDNHGVDHVDLVSNADKLTGYTGARIVKARNSLEDARLIIPLTWEPETVQREIWEKDRDAFVKNLVECLFSVGSVLTAVGCTDAELQVRYAELLEEDQGDGASLKPGENMPVDDSPEGAEVPDPEPEYLDVETVVVPVLYSIPPVKDVKEALTS